MANEQPDTLPAGPAAEASERALDSVRENVARLEGTAEVMAAIQAQRTPPPAPPPKLIDPAALARAELEELKRQIQAQDQPAGGEPRKTL